MKNFKKLKHLFLFSALSTFAMAANTITYIPIIIGDIITFVPKSIPQILIPIASSYTNLKKLENVVLNTVVTARYDGSTLNKTVPFGSKYTSDGAKIIIDYPQSSGVAGLCQLMTFSTDYTYFCLEGNIRNDTLIAYGLNITKKGHITGNIDVSLTGDVEELALGLKYPEFALGYLSGTVSRRNKNRNKSKIEENQNINDLEYLMDIYKMTIF